MLATLFGMSWPERTISVDWGEGYRASALQLAIMPIYFGGVMLLFPFCACTASAPLQTVEIRTGFAQWKLLRGGIETYFRRKVIAGFVGSGLSVASAFLVHALIWAFIAMPSQPLLYGAHDIPYRANTIYFPWLHVLNGWPILLWMAMGIFLMGGIWGTLGLAVAWWMQDPLLAVSLPTFLYFLWNSNASALLGYRLPSAARIYNDQLTWPIAAEALLVNLIWFCMLVWLCRTALRKRLLNA